jgi:molybdopterin synthase sulfur carrier subunit
MLQIHFFARYREALGQDVELLPWSPELACLNDLRELLLGRGGVWSVLEEQSLMCARNEELCSLGEPLCDGDVVAFFPAVTGG